MGTRLSVVVLLVVGPALNALLPLVNARTLTSVMPVAAWTGVGLVLWLVCVLLACALTAWTATGSVLRRGAYAGGVFLAALGVTASTSWLHGVASFDSSEISTTDRAPCQYAPSQPPNVVLIVVDTLRRGNLGLYGYPRDTSRRLDGLADESLVFENGFAQSPSTKPSIASMFTSLYPNQHRAIYNPNSLPKELPSLAEELKKRGYRSAGFLENPMVGEKFGYHRGFDRWTEDFSRHDPKNSSPLTDAFDEDVHAWLEESTEDESGRPFFLYLHYIDPHSPYSAPGPYAKYYSAGADGGGEVLRVGEAGDYDTRRLIDRYDEEIRFIDDRIADVLSRVRLDRDGETVIVFVSDHGEGFQEHGELHHSYGVYGELIRVPLMLRLPGGQCAQRVSAPAQHVDIMPTLLALAGGDPAQTGSDIQTMGVHLLSEQATTSRIAFGEHLRDGWGMKQSYLIRDGYKLVENLDYGVLELYDLEADPHDQHNLLLPWEAAALSAGLPVSGLSPAAAIATKRRAELRIHQALEVDRVANVAEIDDETREALKNLGYVW